MAVGLAVALGVGVAGFLALGGRAPLPGAGGGPADEIPPFRFELRRAVAVPTTDERATAFRAQAEAAARAAGGVLTDLYIAAFLDPANRRGASYEEAWRLFEDGARAAAQADADVLTAGSLGPSLAEVLPVRGRLSAKVLLDERGHPVLVVAIVRFAADARAEDGARTALVSAGQYFLRKDGGAWRISSYDVERADRARAVAGPSASASGAAP
ncbi:MAG TPA: hypothetical protein VNO79_05865 [Actinomycetota bacterium]|nr:hypothetical protein [Actinomycetota bacterium]